MAKNLNVASSPSRTPTAPAKQEMQRPALRGVLISIFPGLVRNITPGVLVETPEGMSRVGCVKHTALQARVELPGQPRALSFWLQDSDAFGDAKTLDAQEVMRQSTQPAWPKQRGTDEQYTPVSVSSDLERCRFTFVDRTTGKWVGLIGVRTAPATPDAVIAAAEAAQSTAQRAAAGDSDSDSDDDTPETDADTETDVDDDDQPF